MPVLLLIQRNIPERPVLREVAPKSGQAVD